MQHIVQPLLKEIALIGDQKSCALIDQQGVVAWYCLWRFDQPSLFSLLIDQQGGYWSVEAEGKTFRQRHYEENTSILVSEYSVTGGAFLLTDFMPSALLSGICRMVSPSPVPVTFRILPTPDYARQKASLRFGDNDHVVKDSRFEFYIKGSHPLVVQQHCISMNIPAGEAGWCVLADDQQSLPGINIHILHMAKDDTAKKWSALMRNITYEGVYKEVFYQSYKAILLMTHAHSGGILAAATTSLPEAIGGNRNYDYRFVWLRDTAMNVSALVRAGSKGNEAERFLHFLCAARDTNKRNLFVPFYDLDNKTAQGETLLPGTGYQGSQPIRVGNNAFDQLQLDAQGNVLLAAKEIYEQKGEKLHWDNIVRGAEFLVNYWMEKDHGIWEEHTQQHFTSSKVLAAISLENFARYADTPRQRDEWMNAARQIREFVSAQCLTSDGAYAVYAGSEAVDVTAALFAVWGYDKPGSPAMRQTIRRIEQEYREGDLYHRHLIEFDPAKEGVFLAGSLWMAQYYTLLKQLPKAKAIIEAVLRFATDLGYLPEEGDVATGALLGNLPQTFVHASLMTVILDYEAALKEQG